MLSWDMDPDMAVYDEGNTDHREGNNSTLFSSVLFIGRKVKTTALSRSAKKYCDHKTGLMSGYCFVVNKKCSD